MMKIIFFYHQVRQKSYFLSQHSNLITSITRYHWVKCFFFLNAIIFWIDHNIWNKKFQTSLEYIIFEICLFYLYFLFLSIFYSMEHIKQLFTSLSIIIHLLVAQLCSLSLFFCDGDLLLAPPVLRGFGSAGKAAAVSSNKVRRSRVLSKSWKWEFSQEIFRFPARIQVVIE